MIITEFISLGAINDYTLTTLGHRNCVAIDTPERLFLYDQLSNASPSGASFYRDKFREIVELGTEPVIAQEFDRDAYADRLTAALDSDDYEERKVVYPYSKTNFRKVVHSRLPHSLYKHYYQMLHFGGIIEKGNGQVVIMNRKPIDSMLFNRMNAVQTPSTVISENLTNQLQSLLDQIEDVEYYRSVIDELNEKLFQLEQDNSRLQTELNTRTIATWY